MKEYNPKTKKWETRTENVGYLKKRDLCKGHKLHDYVLVLPPWVARSVDESSLYVSHIEAYYEFEEGRLRAEEHYDNLICNLLGVGSVHRPFHNYKVTRYFVCSVCGKKDLK